MTCRFGKCSQTRDARFRAFHATKGSQQRSNARKANTNNAVIVWNEEKKIICMILARRWKKLRCNQSSLNCRRTVFERVLGIETSCDDTGMLIRLIDVGSIVHVLIL
jgi:hypothetical protein